MKKKTLSLLLGFLIPGASLLAQSSNGLLPSPTEDELKKESLFNMQFLQDGMKNTGLKPTADKQRLIASTIANDSTGAMMLRDTALFTYGGLRGSGPSAQTGNITVISDFDTSFAYTSGDNFTTSVPRASKTFDANNRLLFYYKYSNTGEVIYREWHEYYDTDTIKKSGTWRMFNATDYSYQEVQYNAAGKILIDTFSQVVPSIPGITYNADRTYKNEYDAQNRWISGTRKNNGYGVNGNVQSFSDYNVWLFYDNVAQTKPSRDSSILVMAFNGNPPATQLSRTYYTYDAFNNMSQSKTYIDDPETLSAQTTNTYNAGQQLLSTVSEYGINYPQLAYSQKTENEYSNNVLTKTTRSLLDANSTIWTEQSKTIYHLNGSNLVDSMAFYNSNLISTTTYTYNNFKNIVEQKKTSYDNNNVAHTSITHNYYTVFDDGTVETGIENTHKGNLTVNVFPNPASDYIDINIEDWKGTATISISNLNGTVLGNETVNAAHTKIDFSRYTAGIYFIKVSSKEGSSIKKIVKH